MRKKIKIEYYTPPKEIAELAERRTRDIVSTWGHNPRNTIGQLAVSLYIQGIEDTANVMNKKHDKLPR